MNHFYENIPGWSTDSTQGELMRAIINDLKNMQPVKIAEIGVYMGRLTAMWNTTLINEGLQYEYHAIDHFEGSIEHRKWGNQPEYEMALKYIEPVIHKVNVLKLDSISASKKFQDEYFDLVYIDASHEYESVIVDINTWFPKVKRGGFLCGDDYVAGWPGVVQAVDQMFPNKTVLGTTQWIIRK